MTFAAMVATFGGAGRLKPAPGTWGSAAALVLAVPLDLLGGRLVLGLAALLAFGVGLWGAGAYATAQGAKDPSEVVIDEVAGLWLVFAFIPLTAVTAILGFLLFRLFDIAKPWPISWANSAVPGALGIMLDDCFAGLAAAAVLWGAAHMFPMLLAS